MVQVRHNLGLDEPLPARYALWLVATLRGDFEVSYLKGRAVNAHSGLRPERACEGGALEATAPVFVVIDNHSSARSPGGRGDCCSPRHRGGGAVLWQGSSTTARLTSPKLASSAAAVVPAKQPELAAVVLIAHSGAGAAPRTGSSTESSARALSRSESRVHGRGPDRADQDNDCGGQDPHLLEDQEDRDRQLRIGGVE